VEFRADSQPYSPTWMIDMVDDNTIMLTRGDLPLIGSNVMDLIATAWKAGPTCPPNQVATVAVPPVSDPRNPAEPKTDGKISISGMVWDRTRAMIPGATVRCDKPGYWREIYGPYQ
jgi:hypothetical protein